MNKNELITRVAAETGVSKAQAETYLNAVLNQISNALATGESVVLPGFGTFEVRERAARTGRNPQTGAALEIPASKSAAFKPGSALKKGLSE